MRVYLPMALYVNSELKGKSDSYELIYTLEAIICVHSLNVSDILDRVYEEKKCCVNPFMSYSCSVSW